MRWSLPPISLAFLCTWNIPVRFHNRGGNFYSRHQMDALCFFSRKCSRTKSSNRSDFISFLMPRLNLLQDRKRALQLTLSATFTASNDEIKVVGTHVRHSFRMRYTASGRCNVTKSEEEKLAVQQRSLIMILDIQQTQAAVSFDFYRWYSRTAWPIEPRWHFSLCNFILFWPLMHIDRSMSRQRCSGMRNYRMSRAGQRRATFSEEKQRPSTLLADVT